MKKLIMTFALAASLGMANAQMSYSIQHACHPDDVKHYDTARSYGKQQDKPYVVHVRPTDFRWCCACKYYRKA